MTVLLPIPVRHGVQVFPLLGVFAAVHVVLVVCQAQGWDDVGVAVTVGVAVWWVTALLLWAIARAARGPLSIADGSRVSLAFPVVAMVGILSGYWRGPPAPLSLGPATVVGTVLEVEHERGYLLTDARILGEGDRSLGLLRVVAPAFEPPLPGDTIRVEVELAQRRIPRNPSTTPTLDARPYAIANSEIEHWGEASWSARAALALRQRLTFDSAVATSLYRALLLGDRSDLDAQTRFAYQDTGTAHLLAISGMNLALLGFGIFAVLRRGLIWFGPTRRLGQGRRLSAVAAVVALVAIVAYGKIIAPSDATDRALIAFVLVAGAIILMRRPSGPRTLALCAMTVLLLDPMAALRPGFQLSFAATGALVLVATPLMALRTSLTALPMGPRVRTVCTVLAVFLVANLVTSVATLPLGLAWFGQLPLHGLWVNLIAIPFMTLLVFPAGVVWAVLATCCPPLADLLVPVLVWLGEAFDTFIVGAGQIVGSSSTQAWPLALSLLCTAGLLMLIRSKTRLVGALLVAVAALAMGVMKAPDGRLELHALDVGHGDAFAIVLPEGQRVVVDVGGHIQPQANRNLAERVVLPSLLALGFERIDLLVLTHGDLDHAGAAPILLERIRVGELWVPPCARSTPAVAESIALVEAAGGVVRDVARGPPFLWGGAELEILWPPPDTEHEHGCALRDNDASLVLRLATAGRRILLTGDIERAGEEGLLSADHRRDLPQYRAGALYADVLKSPHHGSRTSSSDALLAAVTPRFALVSGLPGRAPMPPHPSVLQRYDERHITTCVTGEVGAIRVTIEADGRLEVRSAGGGPCGAP